jgi:hypothetical protein
VFYFYLFSILEGLTCIQVEKLDVFCRICVICNPFDTYVSTDNVKLNFVAFIKLSAVYHVQSISNLSHYMRVLHSSWALGCKMKNEENYLHIRILSSAGRWPHLSTRILKHFNTLFSLWFLELPHYLFEGCHHFGRICFFPSYTMKTQAARSLETLEHDIGNRCCCNAMYKVQLFKFSSARMGVII